MFEKHENVAILDHKVQKSDSPVIGNFGSVNFLTNKLRVSQSLDMAEPILDTSDGFRWVLAVCSTSSKKSKMLREEGKTNEIFQSHRIINCYFKSNDFPLTLAIFRRAITRTITVSDFFV